MALIIAVMTEVFFKYNYVVVMKKALGQEDILVKPFVQQAINF